MPPKIPNAVPRSRGANAPAISADEQANMYAPPAPCIARVTLSISGVVAIPQASDAALNTPTDHEHPPTPIESASEPKVSSKAASVSA